MKKKKVPLPCIGVILIILNNGIININKSCSPLIIKEMNYSQSLMKMNSYNKKTTTKIKSTTKQKIITKVINTKGNQIVSYAKKFIGNPYVHGGNSLKYGTDCSGFTKLIYKKYGKNIPRTVIGQSKIGNQVSFNNLKQGDLIFYSNGGSTPTHVAIYIGNGKIIHASNPRDGIKISPVNIMKKIKAKRIKM